MPLYGLEVTATLHDTAHLLRRRVRMAVQTGMGRDGVEDVVRNILAEATERILRLPQPCGAQYKLISATRVCELEAGHSGKHEGNL